MLLPVPVLLPDQGWALRPAQVEAVFPFHLVLDRDLRVLQAGSSVRRLQGDGLVGATFTDQFRVTTPRVAMTFEALTAKPRSLFLLESQATPGLLLRGQILHEPGADCLFFVGSPWITETANFVALGLTLDDFAASDVVVDYVLLLQNQASALVEAKDLAARLHATAEQLEHLAHHDTLTGLPNRALLRKRLERKGPDGEEPAPTAVSVLMLDLDGFKAVNDSYGHSAGDGVLQDVAERLRALAREDDMVARFGGDEFALVLEARAGKERSETSAAKVAQRVIEALSQPFPLPLCPGVSVTLSASIGIAHRHGIESAEDLLRNADLAMYAAKAGGKARYERYTPVLHTVSQHRLDLASELGQARERGQLRLDYQPILRLDSDRFAGAEALLRWEHPTMGLLAPIEFIEMAEETGAIVEIGAWVLDEACAELRTWREAYTGPESLGVAVNISGRQLGPHLVATVAAALGRHGIDAGCLTLEITEGVIADGDRRAHKSLRDLKALGVWLAIDDFGTGHSSFGRLREYDFDKLKIDRTFVKDLDRGDPTLVAAQIGLAHDLGMAVVAEGVETRAQLRYLREAGCEHVQGFLVARPVAAEQVRLLLAGSAIWSGAAGGVAVKRPFPVQRRSVSPQ